jgi:hypothetical protein
MPTSLEAAVDELYVAFARRDGPKAIDYCSHCVAPSFVEQLLAPGPLRAIPVRPLRSYTLDVLGTAGSVSDFRYFLPRILHVAVTDGFDAYPDLDHIMGRIRLADWHSWPEREQQAVTGFVDALWNSTLTRFPTTPDTEEVLRAIAAIEDDLSPYLRSWEAALTRLAGASHLLAFVRDHFGRAGREYWLTVPDWPENAATTVKAWLGGPQLVLTVTAAAETVTDERTGEVLLEVLSLL